MINVTTRINVILETAIAKPPTRNRWSRRAIARYLGTQQTSCGIRMMRRISVHSYRLQQSD